MGNPHILTEHARLFIGLGDRKCSVLLELLFGGQIMFSALPGQRLGLVFSWVITQTPDLQILK